jgi:hypothetical protein
MDYKYLGALVLLATVCGCHDVDDRDPAKMAIINSKRAAHPHYPVMVHSVDGAQTPAGMEIEVFGSYSWVENSFDNKVIALKAPDAASTMAKVIELDMAKAQELQKTTPAPSKPPSMAETDWRLSLHPPTGVYTARLDLGKFATTFNVDFDPKPGESAEAAQARSTAVIEKNSQDVIDRMAKAEADGLTDLKNPSIPGGFGISTDALMQAAETTNKTRTKGTFVNPFIQDAPFLLLPIDKDAAIRCLKARIVALAADAKKKKAKTANIVVECPWGLLPTMKNVPVDPSPAQSQLIDAGLATVGPQLDQLNQAAK